MQDKRKEYNDGWVRCARCGHKLFRSAQRMTVTESSGDNSDKHGVIEIKCHSCKTINDVKIS